MRKTKIDPAMIRLLVEAGLSDEKIAEKMNWTVGTLRVVCSLQKISLRRPIRLRVRRRLTSSIALPQEVFEKLRDYASRMGTTAADLAEKLLLVIVRDNLYKAVLDLEAPDERALARPSRLRVISPPDKRESSS